VTAGAANAGTVSGAVDASGAASGAVDAGAAAVLEDAMASMLELGGSAIPDDLLQLGLQTLAFFDDDVGGGGSDSPAKSDGGQGGGSEDEDEDEEASAVGMGRRLSSGIRSEGEREYATAQKEYALQRAAEEERERVRLEEVVWHAAYYGTLRTVACLLHAA